ncbi:hypothetical protein GOBAR_DD07716 [Gossypium barbadense]|nr:hypothetical protein GOBAR_DD07716 [Gossypium barbadense]
MVVVDGGVLARENGFLGLRSVGGHVTKKVRLQKDESPNEGDFTSALFKAPWIFLTFCLSGSLYKKSLLNEIGMLVMLPILIITLTMVLKKINRRCRGGSQSPYQGTINGVQGGNGRLRLMDGCLEEDEKANYGRICVWK